MALDQSVTEEYRALLERILESSAFHKSTRSRQLLEYLGRRYFEARGDAIHEVTIGVEFFQRGRDFDPSADSIVRASMRQLRARLCDYYEGDGAEEIWELQVPKGDYRLKFARRLGQDQSKGAAETGHLRPIPANSDQAQVPPAIRAESWKRVRTAALRYGAIALVAGTMFFLGRWLHPVSLESSEQSPVGISPRQHSLMEHFLDTTQGTVFMVPSDSVINLIQSFSREAVSFEEYRSRSAFALDHPASGRDPAHWEGIVTRELLNIGDASIVLRTAREHPRHSQRLAFRQSRDLQARDLRAGNYVFLGSRNANPWVEVFEPKLTFQFERAANNKPARWRNMDLRPGESAWYPPAESSAREQASAASSYAHIALVPNLSHSGRVLMIGGISQPDTEAAGEFVLSPSSAGALTAAMGISDLSKVPSYDMILRTEKAGNTWRVAEVVAFRILQTQVAHAVKDK